MKRSHKECWHYHFCFKAPASKLEWNSLWPGASSCNQQSTYPSCPCSVRNQGRNAFPSTSHKQPEPKTCKSFCKGEKSSAPQRQAHQKGHTLLSWGTEEGEHRHSTKNQGSCAGRAELDQDQTALVTGSSFQTAVPPRAKYTVILAVHLAVTLTLHGQSVWCHPSSPS